MLEGLFILFLFWIIYVYFGYPLCVFVFAKLFGRVPEKGSFCPSVTIVIPAYNEVEHIEETIKNKLSLNYPNELVEIIVISDESDDGTDEIVESFEEQGVKLIRQMPRRGKTSGLNLAIPQASGDIIVFSDANSIYDENAIRCIVENFSDPEVGYVTGKMIYTNEDGAVVGDGCGAYMRYENIIRKYETELNSVVGVDGGIDAVRKDLYKPMNPDQLPDFVLPLAIVEQGYRVVYDDRALLKEEALSSGGAEYRMRVRVSLRAMWALFDKRKLFNPVNFPVFSWELLSHKLLRYLVFIPQVMLIILNMMLLVEGGIYWVLIVMQSLFYTFALFGYQADKKKKATPFYISLPYYFVVLNLAAAQAFLMFLKGKKVVMWKPRVG